MDLRIWPQKSGKQQIVKSRNRTSRALSGRENNKLRQMRSNAVGASRCELIPLSPNIVVDN